MCSAPPGGNPTCGSGPATTGSSTPSSAAGNPINLLSGNKYQEETDLAALPGVLGLELRRYYNSLGNHPGLVGANWRISYEAVLYDFGSQIQILQADGRRLMFQRGPGAHAALCTSPQPQDGQVRIDAASDGHGMTYHWRWADGRTLSFSGGSAGGHPLQTITAATGEQLVLSYAPSGELTTVRDPQGRRLIFIYAGHALRAIDTPLGRLTYAHDSLGRLTAVAQAKDATSAPFLSRLYHHEDRYNAGHPLALTGISVQATDPLTHQSVVQRLSTYAYNTQGLAILSTKGVPKQMRDGKQLAGTGIEQVEVQYLAQALPHDTRVDRKTGEALPAQLGRAILTNSLGQQTQVTSAVIGGHLRLIEMRGPGCSTCGPSDMRYAYSPSGSLLRSTQLDRTGQPVRSELTELDRYGRTARVGLQTHVAGKPEPTRWMLRYEYADIRYPDGSVAVAPKPSVIARPSVVEGREHTLAFEYNAFGQVVSVTESGYSPRMDVLSTDAITRSTTYGYSTIHGRSVLAWIDGPLPNGPRVDPSDSDVTWIRYDSDGDHVMEVIAPANAVTRVEQRDAAGREAAISFDDGYRFVRQELVYSATGKQERRDEKAWLRTADSSRDTASELHRHVRYDYDPYDRLVAIDRADGTRVQTEFDLSGKALRLLSNDGTQVVVKRDTEGRLVSARPAGATGPSPEELRLQYESTGTRLTSVEDDLGTIAAFSYAQDDAADARPSQVEHPFERITRYLYDSSGDIVEQALASGSPNALHRQYIYDVEHRVTGVLLSSPSGVYRALAAQYDDFGRKVLFADPEHGLNRYVWDAADRLLARTDESGNVSRFSYDNAGRKIAAGGDGAPQLASYRYEGQLNVSERVTYDGQPSHTKEVRRSRYDAFGRIVSEEHWQAIPKGTRGTLSGDATAAPQGYLTCTAYRYDKDNGRLIEKIVTDAAGRNHVTGYEWNTHNGRLVGMTFNGQRVVGDIEHSIFGDLSSITWGSGVSERLGRDARGRLIDKDIRANSSSASLIHASWRYDGDDRLISDDGMGAARQYAYDARGSLIRVEQELAQPATYLHDALGNRTRDEDALGHHDFWYQDGKLVTSASALNHISMFTYSATGARQSGRLTTANDNELLRTRYDTAGRPLAVGSDTPKVYYEWGTHGERTSKTLAQQTTWFHYEHIAEDEGAGLRLAAEGAGDGAIISHYLYLSGRAIARVDTPETQDGIADGWFKVRRMVLGWFGRKPLATPIIYALHTDQRHSPVAATGASGEVLWRADYDAFGRASVRAHGVELNLRLPGQYFDAETGNHYNIERSYDPRIGRYLTPDPLSADPWLELGQSMRLTGNNPYAYVSNNPLTKIDPQGLYESDVHYYMTYFLSIVAGMGAEDARTMALATQYIDDNPQTSPIPYQGTLGYIQSIFHNQKQLKDYHFVLSGPDGITLPVYQNHSVGNPNSPQLQALYSYALPKQGTCGSPNDTSLQFMGEYLHAFEDTFSHRDKQNEPIDAVWKVPDSSREWGIGHGLYGHQPDFTYDEGGWNTRESRTFEMELETYSKVTSYIAAMNYKKNPEHGGKFISVDNSIVVNALREFNGIKASEESGSMDSKIKVLSDALRALGYSQTLKWAPDKDGDAAGYNTRSASTNRKTNLKGLRQSDYPAAIL